MLQKYVRRDIPLLHAGSTGAALPWPRVEGYQKKEQSTVGSGSEIGEKVTMKQCTMGKDCRVGPKSKLNNCVLFDSVQIGDRLLFQDHF